jgi:3-oxoacyl-[acyl-carrier protein] reductase
VADQRLSGRTAVVTGAARGLGRVEALALAAEGAAVVANDLNGTEETVAEIRDRGGRAVSHVGDIADLAVAKDLVDTAVGRFGSLEVVVNNAGIIRDKMIFNLDEADWDAVIRVHLRGHFATLRWATEHWREQSKRSGAPVYARVVNTASEASLLGSPGQPNYAAAKAGITSLTMSVAFSCARYGVRANVVCPRARTEMTTGVFGAEYDGEGLDPLAPEHVGPFVAFLASPEAERITGQVFVVHGGKVGLMSAPALEKRFDSAGATWSLDELVDSVGSYFGGRDPKATFAANDVLSLT